MLYMCILHTHIATRRFNTTAAYSTNKTPQPPLPPQLHRRKTREPPESRPGRAQITLNEAVQVHVILVTMGLPMDVRMEVSLALSSIYRSLPALVLSIAPRLAEIQKMCIKGQRQRDSLHREQTPTSVDTSVVVNPLHASHSTTNCRSVAVD